MSACAFFVVMLLGQSAPVAAVDSAVPSSIVAEGVPPIPGHLALGLDRYQNIRSATFADWCEPTTLTERDATLARAPLLILTRFAETNQVHRVAAPQASRFQLTFHPERVLTAEVRPRHDAFSFTADEGGGENYQVYLQALSGGPAVRVTDGKARHTAPRWSPSGKLLAYSSNTRNGRDTDIYVLDPDDAANARLVKEVGGTWSVVDWSPDESQVAAIEYLSINESYVHVIRVENGETRMISPRRPGPAAPSVSYGNAQWSRDGRSLYVTTDRESEYLRLVRYDLSTGAFHPLTPDIPWDVEQFTLSDDGQTIALTTNEDGLSVLRILAADTGEVRSAPQLPNGVISGVKFRPGSRQLALTISTAQSPADVYTFELDDWVLTRWTTSETGGFAPESFVEPVLVHFPSFDGRSIPAFIYHPDPVRFPGKRPAVIAIHGGPEGQFRPTFQGRGNYLINELGIALVVPNVRGSSGYGKTYVTLDNGLKREDSVKDIGALLDWIATQSDLDAARVGVTGGSYGGFMSLAVQATYADRIKAGIDIVGISNFVTFLKNTQEYRRDLKRAEYGDERDPEMRAFLERVSPLAQADKIRNPILIVQGRNDPRVPVSEANQILEAVRRNGISVWYVLGTNEGHGFAKKANQDYLQQAELQFWRQFLLSESQ